MTKACDGNLSGSFRDPSGFLFFRKGSIFRQINKVYQKHYEYLMNSGLYEKLAADNLLVCHEESDIDPEEESCAYKIIQPQIIRFISYPYEWCFSQLKDAALATLTIQKTALEHGMILKDASAYNIQFNEGRPVLIDSLSFEKYEDGQPWPAYRQFCQHFFAPLALMRYTDIRLNQLLRIYLDGIPLDLASALLPKRSYLNFHVLLHTHIHAQSQKRFASSNIKNTSRKISRLSLTAIADQLISAINALKVRRQTTEWADYYAQTNYDSQEFETKKQIVARYIEMIKPCMVWDMGANTGVFSRVLAEKNIPVISMDNDSVAVENNYLLCKKNNTACIYPLLVDFTNPSPSIGWENKERFSLSERGPTDAVLALALIHHLAISNNLPFKKIANFFYGICKFLIIEFISRNDSQVQRLLRSRRDIFDAYTLRDFEAAFKLYFEIIDVQKIANSERIIYLMKKGKQ